MSNLNSNYDVIVVGGGPSGMIAAGKAGERGLSVLLLEKNKSLGEKLKISGGGRCNITNAEGNLLNTHASSNLEARPDIHKFLSNYGNAKPFLYSAFAEFGVGETEKFFLNLGLPFVTQNRNRVFPKSEKATDVLNALVSYMNKNNVVISLNEPVLNFEIQDNKISKVITKNNTYTAKSVIVATGGLSHPETGSTGDGFKWLEKLGHTIHPPTPSIVPLSVEDEWVKKLAGISFEMIKITFFVEGNKVFSKVGPILCTHFGLSGPTILNSSKKVADMLYGGIVTATIDTYPDKNLGELEKHIIKIFDQNKNKTFKNVFDDIAPKGTGKILLTLLPQIDPEIKTHSVTVEMRKQIVRLLKALPITISGLMGFDRAVVADGGVDIAEVDLKTMRSKKVSNLFLTGDMLHIERPSGGFSLQLCWTTGFVAGKNV